MLGGRKQISGCQGLGGERGWGVTAHGDRVSTWGVENVLKLVCGVGCTTLNVLKTTEWHTLKEWTLCSVNCILIKRSSRKPQ